MTADWHERSALELGEAIGAGTIDAVELGELFIARIEANDPEQRVYIRRLFERAREDAAAAAKRAKAGTRTSPLDGVPVCWKDCYDLAGLSTSNGSKTLNKRIAPADAELFTRGANAGLVTLGKTNLTEFCFGGLGVNPVFGTPANARDKTVERIPGGSSSGTAVAIASDLAACGFGSDTRGSVRIPAAWNGLVGLKTTFGLLPGDGLLNLSPSLDTAGPLAKIVADANALLAIMASRPAADLAGATLKGVHFGVPTTQVWDDLDPGIEDAVRGAMEVFSRAGATFTEFEMPEHLDLREVLGKTGSFVSGECWALWGDYVEAAPDLVFEPVRKRMEEGKSLSSADAERVRFRTRELAKSVQARMTEFDALVFPTVCFAPPPIADLVDGGPAYVEANLRSLRNTSPGNFFGLCGLTLPCGTDALGLPVGILFSGLPFTENKLLRIGRAAEDALAGGA